MKVSSIIKTSNGRAAISIYNGVVIVFSDAHYWPGIVSTGHKALLYIIKTLKPTAIVLNGDAFDGGTISRFPRIGWDSKPSVIDELNTVSERLNEIVSVSKSANHIWTLGNHDARFETFLASRVPEYQGIKGFSLKDHFLQWYPCWSLWINGDTVIKHRFKGGIHATHNNALWAGCNIITGHLHSLKHTAFTDYNGTRHGVDTGTLADPNGPQFLDYTEDNPKNHRSGFAVLTFKQGKLVWPELVYVVDTADGEFEFRGERYKV